MSGENPFIQIRQLMPDGSSDADLYQDPEAEAVRLLPEMYGGKKYFWKQFPVEQFFA